METALGSNNVVLEESEHNFSEIKIRKWDKCISVKYLQEWKKCPLLCSIGNVIDSCEYVMTVKNRIQR